MKKSSVSLAGKIKLLEARRRALRIKLIQGRPIIVGNVYDVMRRCGNLSCHCAAKPGHRQTLLIYMDDGRRRCLDDEQKLYAKHLIARGWAILDVARDCGLSETELRREIDLPQRPFEFVFLPLKSR